MTTTQASLSRGARDCPGVPRMVPENVTAGRIGRDILRLWEVDVTGSHSTLFSFCACVLLAASGLVADQHGELAGIRGLPVEGHDSVAAIEIVGTNKLSGFQNMRERFRSNGAELRLGLPLESQTLCRFKEVLRDLLREKGYPDAEIALDRRPTYGKSGD